MLKKIKGIKKARKHLKQANKQRKRLRKNAQPFAEINNPLTFVTRYGNL
jgi:hypothetical protein